MRIALISDTHLAANAPAFRANIDAARAWTAASAADLTVHLGDITVDGAKQPAQLDYASDALAGWPTELRLLPGNHDIGDNRDPSAARTEADCDATRLAHYRQRFGADRWRLTGDGWTLIGLNAQLFGAGDTEDLAQLAWLDHELADCPGPIGLMLHKPLFRNGPADDERHHRYLPVEARRDLAGRLRRHDLRFVVSGHTHQRRRIVVEHVEHVWAPSTAYIFPDRAQERIGQKQVGALMLTLDASGHRFDEISVPGMIGHNLGDFPEVYPGLVRPADQ